MCFLSEWLVYLALFYDGLNNGSKDKMVVVTKETEEEEEPINRAIINLKHIQETLLVFNRFILQQLLRQI